MAKYLDEIGLTHLVSKIKNGMSLSNFGITATATELNYTHGVTSSIQTQLNAKAASTHKHSAADITSGTLPVARGGTGVTTEAAIGLKAYPVGAVYISFVSTSPASLFGGTWTAITGVFPYFNAGTSKGGSNTHTLTISEMPSHSHGIYHRNGQYLGPTGVWSFDTQDEYNSDWDGGTWVASAGGGGSHNNMPAYQTLYAWRRTA